MRKLVAIVGIVLAMCSVALADLIAPPKGPPKERTLTGTLVVEPVMKYAVGLKDDAGKEISLGRVDDLPKTVEYEKLNNKKVVAKVMVQETTGHKGVKVVLVTRVLDIKEAPPAKP